MTGAVHGMAASTDRSAAIAGSTPPSGATLEQLDKAAREGPGYSPMFRIPNIVTQNMSLLNVAAQPVNPPQAQPPAAQGAEPPRANNAPAGEDDRAASIAGVDLLAARAAIVALQLAVVLGLVLIGYRHFDNVRTGVAAATLYLMLPYTAQMTGHIRHVLPAAALVWAIVCYRRPLLAGIFIGLAIGLSYYPIFLLPLWMSFYWQRGLLRFICGIIPPIAVLVGLLALSAGSHDAFLRDVQQMFGWTIPRMVKENFEGFWHLKLLDPVYRIPVLAAFFALAGTMAIWPAQKNLGTLMSCSAAVMLASQFWNAHRGGLFIAWYLPLLLLTIFRPNLEDRVALSVLGQSWFAKRRRPHLRIERAA